MCKLDVSILGAFATATQQKDDRLAAPLEIDAVARPVMDAKLANALPDRRNIAGMAISQAVKAGNNRADGFRVAKLAEPFAEVGGLFEFDHAYSVVLKLRLCKEIKCYFVARLLRW
jgi:hypothetical protein